MCLWCCIITCAFGILQWACGCSCKGNFPLHVVQITLIWIIHACHNNITMYYWCYMHWLKCNLLWFRWLSVVLVRSCLSWPQRTSSWPWSSQAETGRCVYCRWWIPLTHSLLHLCSAPTSMHMGPRHKQTVCSQWTIPTSLNEFPNVDEIRHTIVLACNNYLNWSQIPVMHMYAHACTHACTHAFMQAIVIWKKIFYVQMFYFVS